MMQRPQAALHIGAGAHLLGGAEQDPYLARIDGVEQVPLGLIGVGVMNEGDLVCGDAACHQPLAHIIVDIERFGSGVERSQKTSWVESSLAVSFQIA